MPDVNGIAGEKLKSFVERIERLSEERKALGNDISEIFAEAKGNGFDVKAIRQILKLRAMDANDRDEQEAIVDVYMRALGMIPDFEHVE
jgi:uncharacterized protein (UPF0335 family)